MSLKEVEGSYNVVVFFVGLTRKSTKYSCMSSAGLTGPPTKHTRKASQNPQNLTWTPLFARVQMSRVEFSHADPCLAPIRPAGARWSRFLILAVVLWSLAADCSKLLGAGGTVSAMYIEMGCLGKEVVDKRCHHRASDLTYHCSLFLRLHHQS